MDYVTVFETSTDPLKEIGFVIPGLVLSLAGAVLVFRPAVLEAVGFRRATKWPIFNWSFFLFAVAWTAIVGTSIISRGLNAAEALEEGNCEVIEGKVENFHPMPQEGHDTERFEVDGRHFSYSDYVVSAGFNNTSSHGGPISEGLKVRICHQSGIILRLEVAS